ncbi:aspartate/glutamate racemase family protein [Candidatus Vampirococcus lugosii]|uniref:Aspartate racemase n=1 Tax=Candidatus Vampirococcus lugosii TaxID=2789015 RepID=A0ABS5QM30_9BACT|nr:amino acid racemase [Candidatus Vampirococcus lugosii]MBS8122019.1 aspartate racemase [Candidatus Vampirococcus lugosii]
MFVKLGILGGMGAIAGLYFNQRLIEKTFAKNDLENIETILYTKPDIPDRTCAILNNGISPLTKINEGIKSLEEQGCTHIVIACNTAHHFFDEFIVKKANLINIVNETVKYLKSKGLKKPLLLGTNGTFQAGVYDKYCQKFDISLIKLTKQNQEIIMKAIYSVKAGKSFEAINFFYKSFLNSEKLQKKYGFDSVIYACTEISYIFGKDSFFEKIPSFDPIEIVCQQIIDIHNKS